MNYYFIFHFIQVAETLVNPMGEDDEDFDINAIIDSNWSVSYLLVIELNQETFSIAALNYLLCSYGSNKAAAVAITDVAI